MDVLEPSIVLAPYLEPVVRGRRVVVLGDSTSTLGTNLIDRGARLVHVYDPVAARAAESAARAGASRTLVIAPLPWGDLAVRDGAFDTAIVPDLSVFETPDPVIERARRLASQSGTAIFVSPNPDIVPRAPGSPGAPLSYYELFDAVSLQFSDVRMFGQAPFAGYVIADFAPDDEPDVVVDTSLLDRGSEEPRFFLAIASRGRIKLDPYAVVQVPQSLVRGAEQPVVDIAAKVAPLEAELAAAGVRIRELEAHASAALRASQLESELAQSAELLRKSEARAGDAHVRSGQLENKVRDLEDELRHQRERAFRLSTELEEERKRSTKAALELGMIRRTSELPPKPEAQRAEDVARIAALEADLESSRATITELQAEREAAARRVQELQATIAALQASEAELRDEVEDLRALDKQAAVRLQELQSTLQDKTRRVEALDAHVLELSADTSRADEQLHKQVADLTQEVEALRLALARAEETARAQGDAVRAEQDTELTALEQRLQAQGRELAAERAEVLRRGEIARELLLRLQECQAQGPGSPGAAEPSPAGGTPTQQLDDLAAQCARREAELQRASFRIQELEGRLAQVQDSEPSRQVLDLESALVAAHNEMDALRVALKREHDARTESETRAGEALAQAKADLQAQAVLVATLRRQAGLDQDAG